MIIDELAAAVLPSAEERRVIDVRIGAGYTAVLLDDGRCGVAQTIHEAAAGCSVCAEAGRLAGRSAAEFVGAAHSLDLMKSVLALATINALATVPAMCTEADPVSLLDLRESDVVGMVGYFGPIVGQIRARVRELRVFERTTQRDHDLMPDWAAPALLPECDVAIVTATAIMNRTLDVLLNGTARAREVLILGPSTPLLPVVFANRGVTLLSGITVRDPALLLRIVSEGGGTRQFGAAVRKLTVRIRESRATSAGA